MLPRAAFIPPVASIVCASRFAHFPTIVTSILLSWSSIAALSPAPPEPIIRTSDFIILIISPDLFL